MHARVVDDAWWWWWYGLLCAWLCDGLSHARGSSVKRCHVGWVWMTQSVCRSVVGGSWRRVLWQTGACGENGDCSGEI